MVAELNERFIFAEEKLEISEEKETRKNWTLMIVDDNSEVHVMTKFVLKEFNYNHRMLNFIDAYSANQAQTILASGQEVDVVLLDVIMETDDAGLKLVEYIRDKLKNNLIRIIIRTGQPGLALEKRVITEYDINGYQQKTDITSTDLYSSLVIALRTLTSLREIDLLRKEQEEFANSLMRFVPYDFLKILNETNISNIKIGEYVDRYITILFLDIRSFTAISEFLLPEEIFKFLNECMSYICPIIIQNNGFVDKFIGDALMALFPNSAEDAVSGGIQILKAIQKFNCIRLEKDEAPIKIGIGINTGQAVLGTVGHTNRMDCTAVSDAVNLAARIEKLNKFFGSSLLISEETFNALPNPTDFHFRYLGRVKLPGKRIVSGIYEIYDADLSDIIELKEKTSSDFNEAVKLFGNGEIDKAKKLFEKILSINVYDKVCHYFLTSPE